MNYVDRFRYLDVERGVIHVGPASHDAIKRHWKRRGMLEAVERSGVCTGKTTCACLNCEYKNFLWARAHRMGIAPNEAFKIVFLQETEGAAPTPWADVQGVFGDR